jgi:hypothetical protein
VPHRGAFEGPQGYAAPAQWRFTNQPQPLTVTYLDPIDFEAPEFGDLYDELPLWSAPFGLWIVDHVPVGCGLTILDIGAGTGFLQAWKEVAFAHLIQETFERLETEPNEVAADQGELALTIPMACFFARKQCLG